LLSVAASCGDNGAPDMDAPLPPPPPPPPTHETVSIAFAAMVGDQAVTCGTIYGGFGPSADREAQFHDFRFYVHDVTFFDADGNATALEMEEALPWQSDGLALLDFEDATGLCANGTPEMHAVVTGRRALGDYVGVRFTLGVPFEKNHQDASTAAAPLNLTSLFWNWQGGYKFARLDTSVEPAQPQDPRPGFNFHLGSTGCDGSPAGGVTACTSPNRAIIELPVFDVATDQIVLDYRALVGALDLAVNGGGAPGCMSGAADPECPSMFASLGLTMGDNHPSLTAFSAVTRAQ